MKRLMMIGIATLVSACGCAPYTQVQMKLVEQTRKGIAIETEAAKSHADLAAQLYALRRQRLDDAFDADVRDAAHSLDADWVIEHRRAYAAALEAYAKADAASSAADASRRQNLADTDAALAKLYWLQSIQLRWMSLIPSPTLDEIQEVSK